MSAEGTTKSPINKYMKQLLLVCMLLASTSFAQTWSPTITKHKTEVKNSVQCWGTTGEDKRCSRMIDTDNPKKAVKGKNGQWYCYQHRRQA